MRRPPLVPVVTLGLLTIVTYGASYYAYGVLIEPIHNDTGWSHAALGGIFSAVLLITGTLGVAAGRLLDRAGERPVYLIAATAGAGAMVGASFQTDLVPFAIVYA